MRDECQMTLGCKNEGVPLGTRLNTRPLGAKVNANSLGTRFNTFTFQCHSSVIAHQIVMHVGVLPTKGPAK